MSAISHVGMRMTQFLPYQLSPRRINSTTPSTRTRSSSIYYWIYLLIAEPEGRRWTEGLAPAAGGASAARRAPMVAILAANLAVMVALTGVSASGPSSPPPPPLASPTTWDSDQMERSGAVCVKNATSVVNTRLVFYSLPSGSPPPGGWPVYALFQPWDTSAAPWGSAAPTCGPLYPPFVVESCLELMKKRCPIAGSSYEDKRACYNCTSHLRRTDKAAYEAANCSSEQSNLLWCQQHGEQRSRHSENRPPFENPVEILKPCFSANGSWDPYQEPSQTGLRCSFGAVNGRVWAQRLNQYLLANGIAILQINPGEGDEWVGSAYTDTQWHSGDDRPFLKTLFAQINSGEFGGLGPGTLNLHRLSVSGYSVGAQMVSWMIQVQATGELTKQLNATLRAGAMFAGGTYACYRGNYTGSTRKINPSGNRSKHPEKPVIPMPDPIGQCKGCNASNQCWRVGCSSTVRKLTGQAPCCAYCCPENFTEQFYEDHPEQYPEHPPTFLVQHRDVDENADACAALNYHHTMLKNGGRSEIAMIEEDQAQCYCIGSSKDPAASGAPTLEYCKKFLPGMAPPDGMHDTFYGTFPNGTNFSAAYETYSTERCVRHAMGHADAVEPLTRFLVKYL